jgi:hypothetical protein
MFLIERGIWTFLRHNASAYIHVATGINCDGPAAGTKISVAVL